MTILYKYRIYCNTENEFKYVWGTTPPTTCPTDPLHSVNPDSVSVVGQADDNYLAYGVIAGNQLTVNGNITTINGKVGSNLPINGSGTIISSESPVIGFDSSIVDDSAQTAYT